MRILFTGASSFSGYWFVKELVAAGHQVTAIFRSSLKSYAGSRMQRIDRLLKSCEPIFDCSFGDARFLDMINSESSWDLLCHHAADVTNYKSPDFDIAQAVANNTHGLKLVFDALEAKQCRKIVLTGSVFEQNEGAGSDGLKAFSPYGLSKGFTAEIVRYHTAQRGLKMGKFVIPNPFGPYEDPRFTTYLMQSWMEGKVPAVNTPLYIRDNIHVTLLAKAYRLFVENLSLCPRYECLNPSGYVESQGDFAKRFANEMQKRLNRPCELQINTQTHFNEPKIRINTDMAAAFSLEWSEPAAWDELAEYYEKAFEMGAVMR